MLAYSAEADDAVRELGEALGSPGRPARVAAIVAKRQRGGDPAPSATAARYAAREAAKEAAKAAQASASEPEPAEAACLRRASSDVFRCLPVDRGGVRGVKPRPTAP